VISFYPTLTPYKNRAFDAVGLAALNLGAVGFAEEVVPPPLVLRLVFLFGI
jgi:hypothetical protein